MFCTAPLMGIFCVSSFWWLVTTWTLFFSLEQLYFMAFFTSKLTYCFFGNTIMTSFFSLLLVFLMFCYCLMIILLFIIAYCLLLNVLSLILCTLSCLIIMLFLLFLSDQYLLLFLNLDNAVILENVEIMVFYLFTGIVIPLGWFDLTSLVDVGNFLSLLFIFTHFLVDMYFILDEFSFLILMRFSLAL